MLRTTEEKAYAKINIGLDVLGRREDGYHTLKMVMQTIDLCYDVLLAWEEGGSGSSLPDASNASEGDVLIVGDCGSTLGWGSPFPDYDEYDDVGKVLMITQNSGMMWHENLPTYDTSTDVGKVLMITANGPEWGTPSN